MKPVTRTRSEIKKSLQQDKWTKNCPGEALKLIVNQLYRADDAKARVDEEGQVVRDMKGSVIPHPAIKIEQEATKMAIDLIRKYSTGVL